MGTVKKTIITLCLLGSLFSIALLWRGAKGPGYATVPLQMPFSFAKAQPQTFRCSIQRTNKYLINLYLKNTKNFHMNPIIGDIGGATQNLIDIQWSVYEGKKQISWGTNKKYGYVPFLSETYSGITMGDVLLEKGKKYTLSLWVNNVNSGWDEYKPSVHLELHPSSQEYLIGYVYLGIFMFLSFFSVFIIFFLQGRRNK